MTPEVMTVIGSVLVSLIGGWFMVAQAKKKTTVDVQASLNAGFTGLTDMLKDVIASQKKEIAQLETHKRALLQRNEELRDFIRKHNLDPPEGEALP